MHIVFHVGDCDGTSFVGFLYYNVLLDNSLRALCCCLGRLGLTLCGVLKMKLLYRSLV